MLKYFKHTFWKMEAQMLKHHSWSVHAGPAHSYKFVNEGSFFQNTRIKQTIKEKKDKLNNAINKKKKKLKQGEKKLPGEGFWTNTSRCRCQHQITNCSCCAKNWGKMVSSNQI